MKAGAARPHLFLLQPNQLRHLFVHKRDTSKHEDTTSLLCVDVFNAGIILLTDRHGQCQRCFHAALVLGVMQTNRERPWWGCASQQVCVSRGKTGSKGDHGKHVSPVSLCVCVCVYRTMMMMMTGWVRWHRVVFKPRAVVDFERSSTLPFYCYSPFKRNWFKTQKLIPITLILCSRDVRSVFFLVRQMFLMQTAGWFWTV